MTQIEKANVVIIGAGPSGCCAALRLMALGYSVVLVEKRPFPRPQIGESLSPGIWNILEYIGARVALENPKFLYELPSRVIWQTHEPTITSSKERGFGVIVDRGEFDKSLLDIVKMQGAKVLQPAQVNQIQGTAYDWKLQITESQQEVEVQAQVVLDATGRREQNREKKFFTAPLTLASWTHVNETIMPSETAIEAIDYGWLWGTPLPYGSYRVMCFLDASTFKQNKVKGMEKLFRFLLSKSKIFNFLANANFLTPLQTCIATPYLDFNSWQPGYIKLGESAFALDALSSSGVEKAMRFTLQVVIAINTMLKNFSLFRLAKDFYESHLIDSVATHVVWTQNYYKQAWPSKSNKEFWVNHSQRLQIDLEKSSDFIKRFHRTCLDYEQKENNKQINPKLNLDFFPSPKSLNTFLHTPFVLSPNIGFIKTPCVVEDSIQLCFAVTHPNLDRPVAFLAGFGLVQLLKLATTANNLGQLIVYWSSQISFETSINIIVWLQEKGLISTKSSCH